MARFSDSKISFSKASPLGTATATSKGSSREDRVLPPGSSVIFHGSSVGMLCRTRKSWAGGRLCSTVAKGKVKELFWDGRYFGGRYFTLALSGLLPNSIKGAVTSEVL